MTDDQSPRGRMLENELRGKVTELCSEFGYICHHTRDGRRNKDSSGWPDCVIIADIAILFVELKSDIERISVKQRRVGSKITRAGGRWVVWRPQQLHDGTIRRGLELLRAPAIDA